MAMRVVEKPGVSFNEASEKRVWELVEERDPDLKKHPYVTRAFEIIIEAKREGINVSSKVIEARQWIKDSNAPIELQASLIALAENIGRLQPGR